MAPPMTDGSKKPMSNRVKVNMAAEAWSGSIRPAFRSYNLLSRDSDRAKDWTKVFTICFQVNWKLASNSPPLLSHFSFTCCIVVFMRISFRIESRLR